MKRIMLMTTMSLLLAPAAAAAQTPVGNAYGGQGSVATEVAGAAGAAGTSGSGSGVAGASASDGRNESSTAGAVTPTSAPVGAQDTATNAQDLRGDSLPFTGVDLLLMVAGASALLMVGVGMRRLARTPV